MNRDLEKHPCFSIDAKHKYSRVHLPVAPKCNIQCAYCDRKFDCVNESRPGVSSALLKPFQALEYVKTINKKLDNLSVVGIAGPGDPFANPEETMETLKLIREEFPEVLLCVSTNGLELYPYIEELKKLEVSHITLTINSLDPEVLGKIYSWVRFKKKVYRGTEAGSVILTEQLRCLEKLRQVGLRVKVNTIVIPGINDDKIVELAKEVQKYDVFSMNCIPLFPTPNTPFESIPEPTPGMVKQIRNDVKKYVMPMVHCARCRADAAGILGQDEPGSKCMIQEFSKLRRKQDKGRTRVAVASYEGMLVNQHLGEAESLIVFEDTPLGYRKVEERKTPSQGGGELRWAELGELLSDCRAILVSGVGFRPSRILSKTGLEIIQMTGLISTGLDSIYKGIELKTLKKADMHKCGAECSGQGNGCG